jgi:fructose-1,6-bisphosphatase
MAHARTTFSKFIIEDERRRSDPDPDLTGLLNDVQTACKFIASATARGALEGSGAIDDVAAEIFVRECEGGGKLSGMIVKGIESPYVLPPTVPRAPYLLVVDPIDGQGNLDVNVTVGTMFSVLRVPPGVDEPRVRDFLQKGSAQVAAGIALYGPTSTLVVSLGQGVHGFTLDREIGAYTMTHPNLRIPEATTEFAINPSNERYWEPPVRHYVEECIEGKSGERGADFRMRWVDSLVAEVYRLLLCGGVFLCPREITESGRQGTLSLVFEANPLAMLVEQAGGAASTGRARILEIEPQSLDQRLPVILGSLREVERLERFHSMYDRGEELTFKTPLFNARSLFRTP